MGIEAESRGADYVVCVDKDTQYLNQNKAILTQILQLFALILFVI